jgi:hypothetical protein
MKVQRMNIKKKEVVVTAFEENPFWKLISSSHRTSSVDSTSKSLTTTGASRGSPEEEDTSDDEAIIISDLEGETKEPNHSAAAGAQTLRSNIPSLTISLLDTPSDIEDHSHHHES